MTTLPAPLGKLVCVGLLVLVLGSCSGDANTDASNVPARVAGAISAAKSAEPTVVVAISDSGVNPYHDIYYRPDLTQHPCTYVEGFDCDIPALPLSVGKYDTWDEAFEADRELWDGIVLHQWYWIPQTNIIGAVCEEPEGSGPISSLNEGTICILDDSSMHGTGTSSSVLMEAPDALLLINEGTNLAADLASPPVLPDIQSHSWSNLAPLPLHAFFGALDESDTCGVGQHHSEPLFFQAAGNDFLWPVVLDYAHFCPSVINVGGATSESGEIGSWSFYDFASWWCRPTAQTRSLHDYRQSYCGTSFSAPTAAGTAAAALLAIRRAEGYTGRISDDMVSATVSREDFIHALHMAASYSPAATYPNGNSYAPIPLVPGHEYLVWGWGFLDQQVVPAIVACALEGSCPEKSSTAVAWNEARQTIRETGWLAGPDGDVLDTLCDELGEPPYLCSSPSR